VQVFWEKRKRGSFYSCRNNPKMHIMGISDILSTYTQPLNIAHGRREGG